MPKTHKKSSNAQRGTDGMFISNHKLPQSSDSESEDSDSDAETSWESATDVEPDDPSYSEDWQQLPLPMTFDERADLRAAQRKWAEEKRRIAEMRGVERREAGTPDNQKGKNRGAYGVGGISKRSSQEKRKKLREAIQSGSLRITEAEFDRQMAALLPKAVGSSKQQTILLDMFKKRPRAPSIPSETQSDVPGPSSSKRQKPDDSTPPSRSSSPPLLAGEADETLLLLNSVPSESGEPDLEDEPEVPAEVLETEARATLGDAAVDSIVVADDIVEWVDTILDDAAPLQPAELGSLAAASLKAARKNKDFRSMVLFAALSDFYHWMPRMGRLRTALRVARNHGRGGTFQRVLCAQARFFEANGALKPTHQGRREKSNGLLDDEAFYMGVQHWLRTLVVGTVYPKLLQMHVNDTLLPSLSLKKKTVTIRHCQRWLWKLGYRRKKHNIGVYWDGHERKDVKKRRKEYLTELEAAEPFIPRYVEPNVDEVLPELIKDDEDDEDEDIFIVHDESTLHSNDYQNNHYWLKAGEQVLKKKGRGRLIMISGFLTKCYGLLALTDEMVAENAKLAEDIRLAVTDSTTIIYPDNKAGGDAYWNLEQMIAQLVKAIHIARYLFPTAVIHWVFDNSSAHGSLAKDAFTATKMNVNPGGKVPEMQDTIIPLDNPHGHGGQVQSMVFDKVLPDDHPHKESEGLPKGMKVILAERGIQRIQTEKI